MLPWPRYDGNLKALLLLPTPQGRLCQQLPKLGIGHQRFEGISPDEYNGPFIRAVRREAVRRAVVKDDGLILKIACHCDSP